MLDEDPSGTPAASSPTSSSRDILTREEILNSTARQGDLLQAITSLRPHFLANPRISTRGSSSSAPLVVYVERTATTLEALRSISATGVAEVRYLEPMASQSVYGSRASGGALVVKLYRPNEPPPSSTPRTR